MSFSASSVVHHKLLAKGQFLVTHIDHETIQSILSWILNNSNRKSFTLLINSSGGTPSAIVYFASFLATLSPKVKLKGVAFGECGSAAFALLQCCHQRIAVKHCGFFIHHVNFKLDISCHGYDMQKIEAELKSLQELEEELIQLQSKRCGMSRNDWMKLADEGEEIDGRGILPPRALKLGLIDSIAEHYPIF